MSNRSDARAYKSINGWIGEYKSPWQASYQPIMKRARRGQAAEPEIFPDALQAECAAWRALRDLTEPHMTNSGLITSKHKAAAEALFQNGRVIPVERRASA
jgi:hypothetical protein